ncbi:hypothetical protein [Acaryochloris sp. IP29b_bin.148]|uniref:hypothetical protein n=1 Tax=Acaryochloris sp. IP29b_bin.148 TaxID=2969218 RepID=UPI002636B39D|nr:hypothetical protein [Acaryochloris sp. IP29b_bin.148]
MSHPFNLDLKALAALDLDVVDPVTDDQAASIQGGSSQTLTAVGPGESGESGNVTTLALGEEGGTYDFPPINFPGGGPSPSPYPSEDEPVFTTLALGEEGG